MELKWDDAAVTGPVVFSRDVFDKFTLAPNIKEIYALLQSSDVNTEETGEKKPDGHSVDTQTVKCGGDSDVRNTLASDEATSECKPTQNDFKRKPAKTSAFPEPLVPYPSFTTINARQRRSYLGSLTGKINARISKPLMERVKKEVAEFMKYLQDVSRVCADVLNFMPPGSIRYSEDFFTACLERMMSYPQFYSIQEITSLTTAKFVCEISLNFEKQLLAMGKIDMVNNKVIPEDTQLAVDYETVSNVVPPAKKATSAHTAVSSDSNAEKLSAIYEPQVCLSKEAFLQLLNNSSEFTEAWELPIWVKMNPMKGCSQSKTAYIDPPLLKTEMSCREKSLLFHEESVKLAFNKTVSRPIFFLTSEELSFEMNPPPEDKISRNVVAFEDAGMDFETDLTDLESFGESYKPSKIVKEQKEPKTACLNPSQPTPSPMKQTDSLNTSKHSSASQNTPTEPLELTRAEEPGETSSLADGGNGVMDESAVSEKEKESASEDSKVSSVQCPPTKRPRRTMEDEGGQDSDSDEERLIIDQIVSPQRFQTQVTPGEVSSPRPPAPDPATSSPTNPLGKGTKKGIKRPRISSECDQLGQILRMQNAMLKSTPSKNQEAVKPPVPEDKPPEPKTHSLVKQCVTSYLESREGQGEDATLPAAVPVLVAPQRKRLLREDLQVSAEDEMDYDPPAEGSVLYKLYSLLDVLLMVRSSVGVAHPRHDKKTFRAVPVHVLPKLEYQLCYGAESLTHTEACQLWAERLLHSSTVSFISRINAHTSEVVQMQTLPDDWIQNLTVDFKPARCLNTLYHLLKKVSALQEGRYLLVHKPREGFVTIFKASEETKAARSLYHLQTVHCGPPAMSPGVPWVPLDPLHVLPFHQKHNQPPCTFPPRPPPPPPQAKVGAGPKQRQRKNAARPPQAANLNKSPKKNKKGTRKAQGWKDNVRVKLTKDLQKSQTREDGKTPS